MVYVSISVSRWVSDAGRTAAGTPPEAEEPPRDEAVPDSPRRTEQRKERSGPRPARATRRPQTRGVMS